MTHKGILLQTLIMWIIKALSGSHYSITAKLSAILLLKG